MVGTGILSNSMKFPSPEGYMIFLRMTIYSVILKWSDTTSIFDPVTDEDLITEFDFSPIVPGFHRTFATDAACQQRTLTPQDIWSCPTCICSNVEINISWTCLVSGLLSFKHPLVLLFCLIRNTERQKNYDKITRLRKGSCTAEK